MALRKIRTFGDEVLRKKCIEVDVVDDLIVTIEALNKIVY